MIPGTVRDINEEEDFEYFREQNYRADLYKFEGIAFVTKYKNSTMNCSSGFSNTRRSLGYQSRG